MDIDVMELLQLLNPGWVGALIGVVGIIISLLFALITYKRGKILAQPTYQYSSIRLLDKDDKNIPKDIEILYQGIPVERLTRTYVIFWNNGRKVIKGDEITKKEPLKIGFSGKSEIFSAEIIKYTRSANDVRLIGLRDRENEIGITFDYLDAKDGVLIELLHASSSEKPAFRGQIKGVPSGINDEGLVPINALYGEIYINKKRYKNKRHVLYEIIITTTVPFVFLYLMSFVGIPLILGDSINDIWKAATSDSLTIFNFMMVVVVSSVLVKALELRMIGKYGEKFPETLYLDGR